MMEHPSQLRGAYGQYVVDHHHRDSLGDLVSAREIGSGDRVKIRILEQRAAEIEDRIERLERLEHPNIVAIRDHGTTSGHPFVVADWVDALSVRSLTLTSLRSFPTEHVLHLCLQVARALEHAHEVDVTHGAVSDSTVLVSWSANVLLTDFIAGAFHQRDPHERKLADVRDLAHLLRRLALAERSHRSDVLELIDLGDQPNSAGQFRQMAETVWRRLQGSPESFAQWVDGIQNPETKAEIGVSGLFEPGRLLPDAEVITDIKNAPRRGTVRIEGCDETERTASQDATSDEVLPSFFEPSQSASEAFQKAVETVDEDPASLLGKSVSSYRLREHLGSGMSAHVYRAEHEVLRRTAAVKVLRSTWLAERRASARMMREASTLAKIQHPNVLSIINFGKMENGLPFLITEYLDGPSLSELLRSAELELPRAAEIARQLASGLSAAHVAGVVHRDLKPANVVFTASGDVAKIIDFGLARQTTGDAKTLTEVSAVIGTPRFMAPEQVESARVGPAADLYSLGLVIYYLASGRPPWADLPAAEVMRIRLEQPPEPIGEAGGLGPIIERLLHRNPDLRPSAAEVERLIAQSPAVVAYRSFDQSDTRPSLEEGSQKSRKPPAPQRQQSWLSRIAWASVFFVCGIGATLAVVNRTDDRQSIARSSAAPAPRPTASERSIPPPETSPTRSAAPAIPAKKSSAVPRKKRDRGARAVRRAMQQRGLTPADLDDLLSGSPSLSAWKRRPGSNTAGLALAKTIRSKPLSVAFVRRKLKRTIVALRKHASALGRAERNAIEREYFNLQKKLDTAQGEPALVGISVQAARLLSRARNGEPKGRQLR